MPISMIHNLFDNYQQNKISIISPNFTNVIILSIFILLILYSTEKADKQKSLSKFHTEQLKGLAIFMVILGHLWVHIAKIKPAIVLSGEAVSLFLMISGFGLTSSVNQLNLKTFISKRISRVLIPYWIATTIILGLDYVLLGSFLQPINIALTFIGANFNQEVSHIDYVRWFVTFILIWYALYYFFKKLCDRYFILLLLLSSTILLLLEYYLLNFGWYHFFSFPVGCALCRYLNKISAICREHKGKISVLAFFVILYVVAFKIMLADARFAEMIDNLPTLFLFCIAEWNSIVLTIAIIVISGYLVEKGYRSLFLSFLGKYSYELFLLHGAFLIKYNFAIHRNVNEPFQVILGFYSLLLFLCTICWLFANVTNFIQKKLLLH